VNKRNRLKMDRALARAPEIGKSPLAPPRSVLGRIKRRNTEYQRMSEAVGNASVELNNKWLTEEDYRMRIAYLEKKLVMLGHPAD
jgi:hypothetical protein